MREVCGTGLWKTIGKNGFLRKEKSPDRVGDQKLHGVGQQSAWGMDSSQR